MSDRRKPREGDSGDVPFEDWESALDEWDAKFDALLEPKPSPSPLPPRAVADADTQAIPLAEERAPTPSPEALADASPAVDDLDLEIDFGEPPAPPLSQAHADPAATAAEESGVATVPASLEPTPPRPVDVSAFPSAAALLAGESPVVSFAAVTEPVAEGADGSTAMDVPVDGDALATTHAEPPSAPFPPDGEVALLAATPVEREDSLADLQIDLAEPFEDETHAVRAAESGALFDAAAGPASPHELVLPEELAALAEDVDVDEAGDEAWESAPAAIDAGARRVDEPLGDEASAAPVGEASPAPVAEALEVATPAAGEVREPAIAPLEEAVWRGATSPLEEVALAPIDADGSSRGHDAPVEPTPPPAVTAKELGADPTPPPEPAPAIADVPALDVPAPVDVPAAVDLPAPVDVAAPVDLPAPAEELAPVDAPAPVDLPAPVGEPAGDRVHVDAPPPQSRLGRRPAAPVLSVPTFVPPPPPDPAVAPEVAALFADLERATDEPRRRAALACAAGRAAERAGLVDEARARFEQALADDPLAAAAARGLRRLAFATGDLVGAAVALERQAAVSDAAAAAPLRAMAGELRLVGGDEGGRSTLVAEAEGAPGLGRTWARAALADRAPLDGDGGAPLALAEEVTEGRTRATLLVEAARAAERDRPATAWARYREATEADPRSIEGALGLVRISIRDGGEGEREAIERLLHAARGPLSSAARRRLAALLVAHSEPVAGLVLLDGVDDLPSLELAVRAGRAAGDERAAEAATLRLAERLAGTQRCDHLLRLAGEKEARGDTHGARALAEQALAVAPLDPRALAAIARYGGDGVHAAILPPARGPDEQRARARLLLREGRVAEAEEALIAAGAEDDPFVLRDLVDLYVKAGRLLEAAAALVRAATTGERLADDLLVWRAARLYERAGAFVESAALCRALERGPLAEFARRLVLRVAERTAPRATAGAAPAQPPSLLARAVDPSAIAGACEQEADATAEPRSVAALLARAASEVQAIDPSRAVATYGRALAQDGDHAPALLALLRLDERAALAAVDVRAETLVGLPGIAAGLFAAHLLERAGEPRAAADRYARLLGAMGSAGAIAIYERLLALARRTGDLAAASALAVRREEDDPAAHFNATLREAERAGRASRVDESLARYREAIALRPGSVVAREALWCALAAAGRWAELDADLHASLATEGDPRARVRASERLAFIEGERFGDPAGALAMQRAILEIDPHHAGAMRALERRYVAEDRAAELIALYERLGLSASDESLASAVLLERARLRERLGSDPEDVENDLRHALWKDARCRPALRRLLSLSHGSRDLHAVLELGERLAETFREQPLVAGAFLARAGLSLLALDRPDEAIAPLREAIARGGPQTPWVRGLSRVALACGDDAAAVEAMTLAAEIHLDPIERVRAGLVAGALAESRGDAARAIAAFRLVLAEEPSHADALARALALLERHGDHGARADVLAARADREPDPRRAAEQHVEVAELRLEMGDAERASSHLARALEREPTHGPALALLAALHERAGDWAAAAEALIRRARTEADPAAQKETFFRLGVLYSEHLPDPQRAIASFVRVLAHDPDDVVALERLLALYESTSAFAEALSIATRLARLAADPALRVRRLLEVARIQSERLGDLRGAIETGRRAVALAPTDVEAVAALARTFEAQNDPLSARVHLDTSIQLLRQSLAGRETDAAAWHALFDVFRLRRDGEHATAAAEVLVTLGAATLAEAEHLDRHRSRAGASTPPAIERLLDPACDEPLFPRDLPSGFRNLFRLLDEPLAKAFRGDLARHGVGRADRVPRVHVVREAAARVAQALSVREPELYVTRGSPTLLAIELTDPISIVIGERLIAGAPARELDFFFARVLLPIACGLAVPLRTTPDELSLLLGAIVRQFLPDFAPAGVDAAVVTQEAARIARVIPRKLHPDLMPFALECAAPGHDFRAFSALLVEAGNRAGLFASGSIEAALRALDRVGDVVQRDALLRFVASDDYVELRRATAVVKSA